MSTITTTPTWVITGSNKCWLTYKGTEMFVR